MTELEKMQRAKMYIDKLANGIDPITDREMEEDETLNQVRISRCLFYVSEVLGRVIDNGGEVVKTAAGQLPFSVTEEQLSRVEISEQPVNISTITQRIADVLYEGVKCIPATHITGWLLQNGYFTENIRADKKVKVATPKGEALGIFTVDSVNSSGIGYQKNIYNAEAQRFIVNNIMKIAEEYSH